MKIIRWLLSHIFLILLIIVVIYGYMFWGNLAGRDTPAGKALAYLSDEFVAVENFVNAVKSKQTKPDDQQPAAGNEQVAATTETEQASTDRDDVIATAAEVAQSPASMSYSQNSTRVEQDSSGKIAAVSAAGNETDITAAAAPVADHETPVAAENPQLSGAPVQQHMVNDSNAGSSMVVATDEVFVSPEIENQLKSVDEAGEVIDDAEQKSIVRDTWVTARKAFYQRNYELSESSYKKVIADTVDNFDAYGELGNVYFNQGKNKQAAAAYYEAAAILVGKGQVNRARSLTGLLRHLEKAKADELQSLIDSAAP